MREWTRYAYEKLCGVCSAQITRGRPIQVISLPGQAWRMYRCEACADGPVPPDLPPLIETARGQRPMTSTAAIARSRGDWWE